MVDDTDRSSTASSLNIRYVLEEQFLASKTGKYEDCEDAIYLGPHFMAIIDGATSKTERRWNGETGGRVAAHILRDLFTDLSYEATARQTADIMTKTLYDFYNSHDIVNIVTIDPLQRLTASTVVVSFYRKEVWFIGDCQCLLNQRLIYPNKIVDKIAAEARAMFLEAELLKGATIEELRQIDTGRAFILPLLERQLFFQNNPAAGIYCYSMVDGFSIPDSGILVEPIADDVETIVLASDGYPILMDSLESSEKALHDILRQDPLLFRNHKSTKGTMEGYVSFDDRAYVKVKIA